MEYKFSQRTKSIGASLIRQMFNYAAEVPGHISLGVGIPPFEMPQNISSYLSRALIDNARRINKYTLGRGLPELNKAQCEKLREKGIEVDYETEILTTAGAAGGIFCAFTALVNDGDQAILLSPPYSNHISVTRLVGGTPIHIPLQENKGWELDASELEKAVGRKTKAIVVCNPSNPTGKVFSEEELRRIGGIARDRDLIVFEDDAYDFLTYGGNKHVSLASMTEFKDNVVAFFSASKEHAMTGLRIGWVVANKAIIDKVFDIQDNVYICPSSVSQYAALEALKDRQHAEQFKQELERSRVTMCARLDRMPAFTYNPPEGAYYVFPRIEAGLGRAGGIRNKKAQQRFEEIPEEWRTADTAVALDLLYDEGVVTVPGIAFGPHGENHIRLSFAAKETDINEACDRMEEWIRRR